MVRRRVPRVARAAGRRGYAPEGAGPAGGPLGPRYRERRHNHYLKGVLYCGVCGRALSCQLSKGRYLYFYCLGQESSRYPTGCRERYVAADILEDEVVKLYRRVQLSDGWLERLEKDLEAEVIARQSRSTAERELATRRLAKLETQKRKLLDAYYAGAIDVPMLKAEQDRLGKELRACESSLVGLDANLQEWQEVLRTAMRFAANCADAYGKASDKTRRMFNKAVLEKVLIRDGHVAEAEFRKPFDGLLSLTGIEYASVVELRGFEPLASAMPWRRSTK